MQQRKQRKHRKYIRILAILALVIFCMAGCSEGKTSKSAASENKTSKSAESENETSKGDTEDSSDDYSVAINLDRLIDEAKETPEDDETLAAVRASASESYDFSYSSEEGYLMITADAASVIIPEGDVMPMYRIAGGQFSQDFVTTVYNYFFPEGNTLFYDVTLMEEELSPGNAAAADSILQDLGWYSEETRGISVAAEDFSRRLLVINDASAGERGSWMCYYGTDGSLYGDIGTSTRLEQTDEEDRAQVDISYEDAKAYADDFVEQAGIEAVFHSAMLTRGAQTMDEEAGPYTAYVFIYLRTIDGVEIAATSESILSLAYSNEADAVEWFDEYLTIAVNENGIVFVSWEGLSSVEETVSEDVGMLSFSEAADIFEEMAPRIYKSYADGTYGAYRVEVTKISLCLLRLRESSDDRTGILVPAWVFYGQEGYYANGRIEENSKAEPWIVMAVNAVDGSVIDMEY